MHRICRSALLVASLGLLPASARANGALLPATGEWSPTSVGMRVAIAVTPSGTTRWSDVSLPAGSKVGWLVPVRPGAVVEWAPGPWLDALDSATSPRILPPSTTALCAVRQSFELPPRWSAVRARQAPVPFAVQATADDARTWAAEHGLRISAAQVTRVAELYASGWQVAGIELEASDADRMSATLRVTDDGGAVLPLALTGQAATTNHLPLTVFVVGAGVASLATTQDIDASSILWGPAGSTYEAARKQTLTAGGGSVWLRESASHGALFEDTRRDGPAILSVVSRYFEGDTECASDVRRLAWKTDAVDPAELVCGGRTDLAAALAGTSLADAFVTRLVGIQPGATFGSDEHVELTAADERPVAFRAGRYHPCDPSQPAPPTYEPEPTDEPPSYPGSTWTPPSTRGPQYDPWSPSTTETVYVASDGCGGGGGTVVTSGDDDDDDDASGWDTSDSGDGCSSDTSGGDGWDTSDSDGCSGDTGGDGWDTSDSRTCAAARAPKRRGPSPVSRLVLLVVALLLPLRRRLRPSHGDRS